MARRGAEFAPFIAGRNPSFCGSPSAANSPGTAPRHATRRWLAMKAIRRGKPDDAIKCIDAADSVSPEIRGFIDGQELTGLRDAAEHRFQLEAFSSASRRPVNSCPSMKPRISGETLSAASMHLMALSGFPRRMAFIASQRRVACLSRFWANLRLTGFHRTTGFCPQ